MSASTLEAWIRRGLFDYKISEQLNGVRMNPEFSKTEVEAPETPRELLLDSAIEMNLRLSYEARIEAHENARLLALALSAAGKEFSARSQSAPTKTP